MEAADPLQRVRDDLALGRQLRAVGKVLPRAAPAATEGRALGVDPVLCGLEDLDDLGPRELLAVLDDAYA
jgi:hypothetical protein